MNGELLIFLILAVTSIGGGILMLNLTKVVHMVMALAFTFLSIAGFFFMLEAEFIAVAQILIYGGAVTIMMLFGIMLTRHNDQDESRKRGLKWIAAIGVVAFFVLIVLAIDGINWVPEETAFVENNTAQIGLYLFGHYVIPFELTSIVLLVGLVGAIILARRDRKLNKEGEAHD